MNGMVVALLISAAVEVAGLGLAAAGFRQTWLEHSRGEQFLAPLLQRVRRMRAAGARWLRTLARRPRSQTLGVAGASMSVSAGSARAVITWGPLPDPAGDQQAFAEQVQDRLNQLHRMGQDAQHDLAEERSDRKSAEGVLRFDLASQAERIEGMAHQVAVGGLRLQVVGWSFVLLGSSSVPSLRSCRAGAADDCR